MADTKAQAATPPEVEETFDITLTALNAGQVIAALIDRAHAQSKLAASEHALVLNPPVMNPQVDLHKQFRDAHLLAANIAADLVKIIAEAAGIADLPEVVIVTAESLGLGVTGPAEDNRPNSAGGPGLKATG
jgi:hypothetical protein